ncbi:peptidase M3A/M3B [Lactifluus volemus]|nr:peptidase M3A/M3B [Lactifluus volemus]
MHKCLLSGLQMPKMNPTLWDIATLISSNAVRHLFRLSTSSAELTARLESKCGHAVGWPLLPGYLCSDGKFRIAHILAVVASLAKPTPDRPALMYHEDAVSFFHEMRHVFHGFLSRTYFSLFHETSFAHDFVEAPSQMLENWCSKPKVVEKISRHYKTGEALSPELIEKIVQSRKVNIGLFFLRQLAFAWFDVKVHTHKDKQDTTTLWNDLQKRVSLVKSGKIIAGQGSFRHPTCGYDASYYTFIYGQIFAVNMYSTIKDDLLDPKRGDRDRKSILQPGGSREELDSLEEILGPDWEAFMEEGFE